MIRRFKYEAGQVGVKLIQQLTGKKYEWHDDDPMELKWVILWHMTRSKNKQIRIWAQRKWGH